ncbi:hypothetical protein AB1N83_012513 [Pleurotus pulmonarius]
MIPRHFHHVLRTAMVDNEPPPAILTIAGSDSSGGAGIQADLRTFAALGCYGSSAITALTAQNTTGVQGVYPIPPEFVSQQLSSVLSDIEIHAIKTGMLHDTDAILSIVQTLNSHYTGAKMPPIVCDPVCVSTSGHTLLQPGAIGALIQNVFPISTLITPNKAEAELLVSRKYPGFMISSLEDMVTAATRLVEYGSACLVKGGHITASLQDVERVMRAYPQASVVKDELLEENMEILQVGDDGLREPRLVVDVLDLGNDLTLFVRPFIVSENTHGTGCTLSSAIASELGRGKDLKSAVRLGVMFTHLGITTAPKIGQGHGPLNHLHSISRSTIPGRTPSNPFPFTRMLIRKSQPVWKQYVEHDFVKLLGQGILPKEAFIYFIKQDYHYLKYYARAHGLLASKSNKFGDIHSAADIVLHIMRELETHKSFCAHFGITVDELESTPQSLSTIAYGSYLIDIGMQGDPAKLTMALLACLLGYGEVGLWLKREASKPDSWVRLEGNPYLKWIEDYSGLDYQAAVRTGLAKVEEQAIHDPPSPERLQEWCEVWEKCTWLEKSFWDAAMSEGKSA